MVTRSDEVHVEHTAPGRSHVYAPAKKVFLLHKSMTEILTPLLGA